MAQPSTEVQKLRQRVTKLAVALDEVEAQADVVTLLGGPAFAAGYLVDAEGNQATDISLAEFAAGLAALQLVLEGMTVEARAAIVKLLI